MWNLKYDTNEPMKQNRKHREQTYFTHEKSKVLVAQLCLTLCKSRDCPPPGSSVHAILQARIHRIPRLSEAPWEVL